MSRTFNMVGGGGGKAVLAVTVTNGTATSVTATKSGVSVSLTDSGGTWIAELPSFGAWTVTITDGTHTNSATVNASTAGIYTVAIYMPDVPSAYTQLEYLESSGLQYIDTGVKPDANAIVYIDGAFTAASPDLGTSQSFGTFSGGGAKRFYLPRWNYQDTSYYRIIIGTAVPTENVVPDTNRHKFKGDRSTMVYSIDDRTFNATGTAQTCTTNFLLFANNGNYEIVENYSRFKLFECWLVNGGSMVRRFYAARRNSDNVLGLYDTVNNVFYTNAGAGTFIAGPAV